MNQESGLGAQRAGSDHPTNLTTMGEDKAWVELRGLLEGEVEAMSWRLGALTDTERESFLDELTDRLSFKVHLTR